VGFRVRRYRLEYSEDDIAWVQDEVARLLRSGWLTQGPWVERLETAFAEVSGAPINLAVSSGTAALEVLYWLHGAAGATILVPTNTYVATAAAALNVGARVVLTDIDPQTMAPTAAEIEWRLRPDTRVVCLVHVAGVVTRELADIRDLCRRRGVALIEDAAHAHGATYRGHPAGTLADGAAFSLHHSKVLTSGEGGVVCLSDPAAIERVKRRRCHGIDLSRNNWEATLIGHNYKMSEMSAILGLVQLRRWRQLVAARRRVAAIYDAHFRGAPLLQPLNPAEGCDHGLYKYVLLLDPAIDKEALMHRMQERHGIELPPNVYDHPCHTQPIVRDAILNGTERFPRAEEFVRRHVCLPMYAALRDEEARLVADAVMETVHQWVR